MRRGDDGRNAANTHPAGVGQRTAGAVMVRRVPSAKNPLKTITRRRTAGKTTLPGPSVSFVRNRLTRKKIIPVNAAIPSISPAKDKILASINGMVKTNWDRIAAIKGMSTPQNNKI